MEMIIACVLSFAVTGLLGWKVILPALRRLKAGQEIREVGPKWHSTKAGTPTMGGLMFIIGIAVSILVVGWPGMMAGDLSHIYVFLFAAVFGCIGFLDDFEKVKLHRNLGLTAIQKFMLQLAAAMPLATLALAALAARLILGGKLPESSLPVAAGVIAGLVAFLGALIAALHSGRRKLLCGLGAAGGYALFLLLGNLLFFGVHYGEALPVLLPLAGAGLLGALLGAGRRKKRRYA